MRIQRSFLTRESILRRPCCPRNRTRKVREILEQLSERDRRLLHEVFLEERDKDEVCRDFGVERDYLRVLLVPRKKSRLRKRYGR